MIKTNQYFQVRIDEKLTPFNKIPNGECFISPQYVKEQDLEQVFIKINKNMIQCVFDSNMKIRLDYQLAEYHRVTLAPCKFKQDLSEFWANQVKPQ